MDEEKALGIAREFRGMLEQSREYTKQLGPGPEAANVNLAIHRRIPLVKSLADEAGLETGATGFLTAHYGWKYSQVYSTNETLIGVLQAVEHGHDGRVPRTVSDLPGRCARSDPERVVSDRLVDGAGPGHRGGAVGDCFDNAAMEAFWATLKKDLRHIHRPLEHHTRSQLRTILFDYIGLHTAPVTSKPSDTAPPPRPTLPPESPDPSQQRVHEIVATPRPPSGAGRFSRKVSP